MRAHLICLALLPLAACSAGASSGVDSGPPGIAAQGSGATRTYPVDGFTAVSLRGSDDVDVRVGPGFSVRADGDADVLDQVKIWKEGTTLMVGRLNRTGINFGGNHAKIAVTLPALTEAAIAGSGNLSVDRVQGAAFTGKAAGSGNLSVAALQVARADVSLAGSGNLKLAGSAQQLAARIAGSGNVDAGDLRASQADISVAGSGNVRATVDGPAKVSVMGSGDVDLGGKAQCQTTKMGSGSVRCGN